MKYCAILGRQPEFGLVELECKHGKQAIFPFGKQAVLLSELSKISNLGGTQKIGRVIYRGKPANLNSVELNITSLPMQQSKTPFGLSFYDSKSTTKSVIACGLELKKRLKTRGSSRFVAPAKGTELSAAQLKYNHILSQGFELLVVSNNQEMVVAITEQVQDIDWYSKRDYERPARSAKVGMLPPKLAQIMINTSEAKLIYDPFCGTGVILQEALLMGRRAAGSDIEPNLVLATKENLTWLKQQITDLDMPNWEVKVADAQSVKLPNEPLAIISEGYLGPNQSKRVDYKLVQELKQNMNLLTNTSLSNWSNQLQSGADIAITLPHWQTTRGAIGLDILDRLPDLGYTLKDFKHVDSKNLIYRRPDQFVGRQLLLLKKA